MLVGAISALRRRCFPMQFVGFRFSVIVALVLLAGVPSYGQPAPSAEDARTIEFGKGIYKEKANCQYCHKWDASGDTGYGGVARSLRKTALTREQFTEIVKCGRPLTGMP